MKASAVLFGVVLLTSAAFGQGPEASPSFDVASVKVIGGSQGLPDGFSATPRRSGGRISWTTNQGLLLRYAWNLPDWRIVRMDKNNDGSFYAIDATMDPSTTEDRVRLMLQNLLTGRFQLTSHRETKEVQGYALSVAKNGPKIKATGPNDAPAMPDYLGGKPSSAFEGRIFVSAEGKGTSALTGRGVSMAKLADTLSAALNTLVVDQTDLTGNYYFGFRFLSVRDGLADDVGGITIFTALQDELGLKLEKQKGTADVLVIDHFAQPSANE